MFDEDEYLDDLLEQEKDEIEMSDERRDWAHKYNGVIEFPLDDNIPLMINQIFKEYGINNHISVTEKALLIMQMNATKYGTLRGELNRNAYTANIIRMGIKACNAYIRDSGRFFSDIGISELNSENVEAIIRDEIHEDPSPRAMRIKIPSGYELN